MHPAALTQEEFEAGAGQLELRFDRWVGVGAVGHANDPARVHPLEIAFDSYDQIFLHATFESSRDIGGDVTVDASVRAAGVGIKPIFFRAGTEGIASGVKLADYVHTRTTFYQKARRDKSREPLDDCR